MLNKIKQNRKIILLAIMSVVVILLGIIAVVFLFKKTPDYTFKDYNSKQEKEEKNFENADSNIKFDGELDDSVWGEKRWLDVVHLSDSTIRVRMTSYFGEDGLYMAFDVDDLGIYYDRNRDTSFNSGIQLYLSPLGGAKDITGYGYEITMNAGNETEVKKYQDGAYEMCPGKVEIATKIKGELNSADAKGYTMEAFIDYNMLGDELDSVFANPAILRSFSNEKDERQWYCFGIESRGASWTQADTWWTFDKDGLVAYDVSIASVENGKIKGQSYAVHGDDYTFEVIPDEGYYAAYLLINNKDATKDLYYQKGKTYYTVEGAKEDLEIKATFMPVPENKINISGEISDGSATISGVKAWAVKNGYAEPLSVDANGNYSATVPAIEGLQIFVEAPGYVSACVTAKDGVNNITLQKEYFGENKSVKRSSSDVKFWDLTRLYEDRVRLKSAEHGMQLVHSNIYSNSVYASANVITNASKGIDTRVGFTFYKDANTSVIVALTMSGEINENNPKGNITCGIQMITEQNGEYTWTNGGIVVPLENQEAIIEAATGNKGIPMAVHYCNSMFDVWVNGEQVAYCIYPTNEKGQNLLDTSTKMAVGLECWSNKAVYEELKFDGNYPVRTVSNVFGWDLSQVNKGIVKSLTNNGWTQAMLTTGYANKVYISANIPLPLEKGKDTRAGFYFKNQKGEDVFVALTMSGQKNQYNPTGDLYYTIQVISKDYTSWDVTGHIEDVSKWEYVKTAASSSEGLPVSVYVEDGKFTIGINGYLVAENVYASDKNGKNVLDGDTAVMAGLATSGTEMVFTNVAIGTEKPDLKDAGNLFWDFAKISKGEVSHNKKDGESKTILWPELRDKYYVTANIVLSKAEGDVRSGYRFEDKDGNAVYVALLCENGEKYKVQIIYTPVDGERNWVWESAYFDDTYGIQEATTKGIPMETLYQNGKFSVWVNNKNIGTDIVLKVNEKEIIPQETKMSLGLECWDTAGQFYQLSAYDKKPIISQEIPDVITQESGGEPSVILGDYSENDKYVVLTGQLKALDSVTHDWSKTIVLGVSGTTKWDNYAFQLAYGQSSSENLVKLLNGKGYGNFDGVEIVQDQWYNNAKLEKVFTEDGVKVQMIRMNTWAYLFVDMGQGYELIGKMYVDANLPTQFTIYNDNTALSLSDIEIKTGEKTVLDALDGATLDICPTTYFPINSTKWTLQGKLAVDFTKLTKPVNRIIYAGTDTWSNNLAVVYRTDWGFQIWGTENLHNWNWTDIAWSYIDAMNSSGMWVRWERDGATLSFSVSNDGENWTHITNNTNLGTNAAGLYVQSEAEFGTMLSDIELVVDGVVNAPTGGENKPAEAAAVKYEPKVEQISKTVEAVGQKADNDMHSPTTGDTNNRAVIAWSSLLIMSALLICYQSKKRFR